MTQEEKKRWIRGHWLSLDKKLLTTALKRYWGVDKNHIASDHKKVKKVEETKFLKDMFAAAEV